jgi:hypothetical protein
MTRSDDRMGGCPETGRKRKKISLCAAPLAVFLAAASYAAPKIWVHLKDLPGVAGPLTLEVAPDGSPLLKTRDNIYDASRREFLFEDGAFRSVAAVARQGRRLLFIADGKLYVRDKSGVAELLEVPLKSPALAADGKNIFILGLPEDGKPTIYLYKEGTGHQPLLRLPEMPQAVCARGGALYFVQGRTVYALEPGKAADIRLVLPRFVKKVVSLDADPSGRTLYFSDGTGVAAYSLRDMDYLFIHPRLSGQVRYYARSLFVLNDRGIAKMAAHRGPAGPARPAAP